jgi:hypothetical protein
MVEIEQRVQVSEDGQSFEITNLGDAHSTWKVPYGDAVWLARSILELVPGALENQETTSGEVKGVILPSRRLSVDSATLHLPTDLKRGDVAALSIEGKWSDENAPGSTTLLVDKSVAEDLVDQLQGFLNPDPSLSRPS